MFRSKCLLRLVVVFLTLTSTQFAFAQVAEPDVYISFSDFGGEFAPGNITANFGVGETGSAYIWVNDNQDIDTLQVTDVLLSNASTIALTSGTTFNFDIISNAEGNNIAERWDSTSNGTVSATGDSISGLFGFNNTNASPGMGIRLSNRGPEDPGSNALDQGYDTTNGTNSFLFARVDFVATGTGSTNILPAGFFINNGIPNSNLVVANATVNVVAVPEPTVGLVSLVCLGLIASRRNRRN